MNISQPDVKTAPVSLPAPIPTTPEPIPRAPTIEDFPILKDIDTLKEVLELLQEMSDQNISSVEPTNNAPQNSATLPIWGDISSFNLPSSSTAFPEPSIEAPPLSDIPSPLPLGNDGSQISFELPHNYPKIDIPLPTSFVPNRTITDVRPSINIPDLTPSLPSKSEFKILSDQVALQNILNMLKLTNSVPNLTATPSDVIRPLSTNITHDCGSTKCNCTFTTPDIPPPYNCAVNQCDPPKRR